MESLIKIAKEGDKDAMEAIIKRFNYFVIKQAGKYKIPSYDFDDLIQHGFLSIIKAVKQYKLGNNNFTTYCTNAITNNFNALLKGQIKHFREVQNDEMLMEMPFDFTLEEEVVAHDLMVRVMNELDKFSLPEKQLVQEVYFNQKTLKETAIKLDLKYKQAFRLKEDIIGRLRKAIK